jgi:glycosyltransferase involved in cell wall biosynthesis
LKILPGGEMNVSVVVPVYKGAKTLDLLTERLKAVLPMVAERFELILVNDDSPDERKSSVGWQKTIPGCAA